VWLQLLQLLPLLPIVAGHATTTATATAAAVHQVRINPAKGQEPAALQHQAPKFIELWQL
jgi:hypothetical protein